MEAAKAIVAAQRDFGNREIRANARAQVRPRARGAATWLPSRARDRGGGGRARRPRILTIRTSLRARAARHRPLPRARRVVPRVQGRAVETDGAVGASRTGWAGTTRRTARSSSASTSSRAACSTSPTARAPEDVHERLRRPPRRQLHPHAAPVGPRDRHQARGQAGDRGAHAEASIKPIEQVDLAVRLAIACPACRCAGTPSARPSGTCRRWSSACRACSTRWTSAARRSSCA